MVSHPSEPLLDQIRHLAGYLPQEKLQALAQAMQQSSLAPVDFANTLHQILPNPSWRQMTSELLAASTKESPALSLPTVAAMLSTAAYSQQQFQRALSLEFLWTGPLSENSHFRRTDQALLELIRNSQESLIIISFAVYDIPEILEALHQAQARNVALTLIFEIPESSNNKISFNALKSISPILLRTARLLIWPKENRPVSPDGKTGSLHAKLAIADNQNLFISSANLTGYAMKLNIEMGVLIHSQNHAVDLSSHIERLISIGEFAPYSLSDFVVKNQPLQQ
jgi:phosphatidylserine/phosphatidylglycerophosphate/cardiolipin synthase-like enzyme